MADEPSTYTVTFGRGPLGIGIDPPHEDVDAGSMVTLINPNGQAGKDPNIRVGDPVISINDIDVQTMTHEQTAETIKTQTRPITIVFQRAPFHQEDSSKESDLQDLWGTIEVQGCRKLPIGRFMKALQSAGIPAKKENIKSIVLHLKEICDQDDGELDYEKFLRETYAHATGKRAYKVAAAVPEEQSTETKLKPKAPAAPASGGIKNPHRHHHSKTGGEAAPPSSDSAPVVAKKKRPTYYVYTEEDKKNRRPPLYKPFVLQEAYALSTWAKHSVNTGEEIQKSRFQTFFQDYCKEYVITIPTLVEKPGKDGEPPKKIPHKWITEEKKMVSISRENLKTIFQEEFKLTLPPRYLESAFPKEPTEEYLSGLDPKMAKWERDEMAWDKMYEDAFVSFMMARNKRSVQIQRSFRQYALRQRCFRRSAARSGKRKWKRAYRAIRFKQLVEAKDQSVEQFEVVFAEEGPIGLGIEPPPYWESGNIVTLVVPGGAAYKQGKLKRGDYLIRVEDTDVTRMGHEASLQVIANASRPCKCVFRRFHNRAERERRDAQREAARLKLVKRRANLTKRSVKAKSLADERIAELEEQQRQEVLRLEEEKRQRAVDRRLKRQAMRESVQRRVQILEGKIPERAKTRAARCPMCTLPLPCIHYKNQDDLSSPANITNIKLAEKQGRRRQRPESNGSSKSAEPAPSRPLTSSYNEDLGIDMAPISFAAADSASKGDYFDTDILEGDLKNPSTVNASEKAAMNSIMEKDTLPLRYRVTLSRLENHKFASQVQNKKRGLLVTPPIRKLCRSSRKTSPRQRRILEKARQDRIVRDRARRGYYEEKLAPEPEKDVHHRKDLTPNGSMFHLCLIPPSRPSAQEGHPSSNQSSRTATPMESEISVEEMETTNNHKNATLSRNERMERLDYMLEQRRWAEEQVAAAEKIQASFRGYQVRKDDMEAVVLRREVEEEIIAEERDEAAIKIQALYRKRMAAMETERRRADRESDMIVSEASREREEAAKKIQALSRGRNARNNVEVTTEQQRKRFRQSLAIRGVFQHIDKNHNGIISREELKSAIAEFSMEKMLQNRDPLMPAPTVEIGSDIDLRDLEGYIGRFDHKNYGVRCPEITMKAFIHWMHGVVEGKDDKLPQSSITMALNRFVTICKDRIAETIDDQDRLVLGAMFDKFDVDQSGTIDLVELRKMIAFFSKDNEVTPTVIETKHLMNIIDSDKTYRMERNEWIDFVRNIMNTSMEERKRNASALPVARKLISFTHQIEKGVHRFLINTHELWSMYDKDHCGFLNVQRVQAMLWRAYKSIFTLTRQSGARPKTPSTSPTIEDTRLFIGVINSTSDKKHHSHDADGNKILTESSFTSFMLEGLKDASGVQGSFKVKEKRTKAVFTWRYKMVKLLMWGT